MYLLIIIFSIFSVHALASGTSGGASLNELLRAFTFIIFTSCILFAVPQLFEIRAFLSGISRVSALIVLIGLPTAVIGSYSFIGIAVTPHIWGFNLPLVIIPRTAVNPITSVMDNPNVLGFLASLGFACGLYEIKEDWRRSSSWTILCINGIGGYLTGSRAAAGALAIAISIYILYTFAGSRITAVWVIAVLAGATYTIFAAMGVLPAPQRISAINLRDRGRLALGVLQAVENQPLIGVGLGNHLEFLRPYLAEENLHATHNSYIRMLLTTGYVGATAYILLMISALRNSFKSSGPERVSLIAGMTVIVFHQLWEGFSIFGLTTQSALSAMLIGYVLKIASQEMDGYSLEGHTDQSTSFDRNTSQTLVGNEDNPQ